MRGYHVGGRSLMWGRQSYRLTDFDFTANLQDGIAVDWPIRYKDLAPWYNHVEEFIGVSGENVGLPQFPDGNYLKAMEMNCVEDVLKSSMSCGATRVFPHFGYILQWGADPGVESAFISRWLLSLGHAGPQKQKAQNKKCQYDVWYKF